MFFIQALSRKLSSLSCSRRYPKFSYFESLCLEFLFLLPVAIQPVGESWTWPGCSAEFPLWGWCLKSCNMGDKHSFPFPRDFRPHGALPLWKVSQGSTLIHVTPSTQHLQETQSRALYSMQPLVACKLICVEPRKSLVVQIPDLCAQLVSEKGPKDPACL